VSGVRDDSEFETVHVDAALALASVVAERTFRNPRLSETPIKRRGVVAAPEGEGS